MPRDTTLEPEENSPQAPTTTNKFITVTYNIIGIVLGIIMLFSGNTISIMAVIVYPLLGIVIFIFSKGLIKLISDNKKQLYSSMNMGFMATIVFSCLKSCEDYTLLNQNTIWLPFIAMSLIMCVILYNAGINPFNKDGRANAIFIFLLMLAYGYGNTRLINCAFDSSEAKTYKVVIVDEHESRGRKSTYYYATITPWGPVQEEREEEIDGWLFDHTKPGDTVQVNFKPGLLKIPWYVIKKG